MFDFFVAIIGFDTFSGFPSISTNDPDHAKISYLGDVDFELIQKIVSAQEKNKAIPLINKIELIQGDATLTIPKYIEENPHLIISLLYLDFDLYEPTKIALQHFLPRVPIGGIVGFDELNQAKWAGETQALNDVLKISRVKLRKFDFDPHVTFFERI